MRHVYICDKCNSEKSTEEEALRCESLHRKIEPPEVRFSGFGTYGTGLHIPKKVFIRFSDAYGDYALFELTQYGPKGL